MKREIKFRVWHPILGMQLPFDMFQATSFKYDNGDGTKCLEKYYEPECTFLQFTGLVLQNKDIYENDIVLLKGDHEESNLYYKITFREDVYAFVGEGGPGEWLHLEELEEGTLAGNIYTNPELVTPS